MLTLGLSLFLVTTICLGQTNQEFSDAALDIVDPSIRYDPSYFSIPYPGGDVPSHLGVCTDVVIRAFRHLDIDLQKLVHEDMRANFNQYPKNWGLKRTDTNIDHRRVPNLMTYFERKGMSKSISSNPDDYHPGDIVCWNLGGGITHIGIVVAQTSAQTSRPLIVHNIGSGQVVEDILFDYTIIGHYRYFEE
jgi:uncharacterized protein YijF (DUF1287 family)